MGKIGEGHAQAWVRAGTKEIAQILPAFPAHSIQPVEELGLFGNPTQHQVEMSQTDRVEEILKNRAANRQADFEEYQRAQKAGPSPLVQEPEIRANSVTGNPERVIPVRDKLEAGLKKVVPTPEVDNSRGSEGYDAMLAKIARHARSVRGRGLERD